MSEEWKCWICKRTSEEALKAFNEAIQSDIEISEEIKPRYIEGQYEFLPVASDMYIPFRQGIIQKGKYSVTGEAVERVFIWLCPVCSGLFQSILDGVDKLVENRVSREDLENVTIRIKKGE